MRSLRNLVVGLAAVGMLAGAGVFSAAPASAQSTTGGCFAPCDSAWAFLYSLGYFVDYDFSSDPRRCRAQCGDARKGCYNAVSSSERCLRGSVNAFLTIERRSCDDFEGSQAECRQEVNSEGQSFRSFLKEDAECGRAACQDGFEDCVASCDYDL